MFHCCNHLLRAYYTRHTVVEMDNHACTCFPYSCSIIVDQTQMLHLYPRPLTAFQCSREKRQGFGMRQNVTIPTTRASAFEITNGGFLHWYHIIVQSYLQQLRHTEKSQCHACDLWHSKLCAYTYFQYMKEYRLKSFKHTPHLLHYHHLHLLNAVEHPSSYASQERVLNHKSNKKVMRLNSLVPRIGLRGGGKGCSSCWRTLE